MQRKPKQKGLSYQQIRFFRLLGRQKPRAIHPKLVLIYKYPIASIICHLLYWQGLGKRSDGYIYKTELDLIDELGITSAQQKRAINKSKDFGFLEVVRKGIPAKRHYKLNFSKLVEATVEQAKKKNIILSESFFRQGEKRLTRQTSSNLTNIEEIEPSNTNNTPNKTANSTSSISDIVDKKFKKS